MRFHALALTLALGLSLSALAAPTDGAAVGAAPRPLVTGLDGRDDFAPPLAGKAFPKARALGARIARIIVLWAEVAPKGNQRPAGFDAKDPGSAEYNWAGIDAQIELARKHGLEPLLTIYTAPAWASGPQATGFDRGPTRPSPAAFADFATAAARRYAGTFEGLPRVRLWGAWNEPNLSSYLWPQYENGRPVSPAWYRKMLNAFYDAVHDVRRDNRVVAGATVPFTINTEFHRTVAPVRFTRELLCLSAGENPRRTCGAKVKFDIWGHHPYTSGGPTHEAARRDDVSILELPQLKRLLDAAERNGTIVSARPVEFWVDEFSWDSAPPDRKGAPLALLTRWVSEALYRMWSAGVTTVIWYQVYDDLFNASRNRCGECGYAQSGFYFNPKEPAKSGVRPGRPKPSARAFRFPFVAFRGETGTVELWGRTPTSKPATVVVERRPRGGGWRALATLRANRYGIFQTTLRWNGAADESLRARASGELSAPFSLVVPADRPMCPFGTC